jgi:RimJ/RimL family protein N-acetyltransferase
MNDPEVSKYLPDRIGSLEEMNSILTWLSSNYDMEATAVHRLTLSVNLKNQKGMPLGWVTFGPLPEDETLREIGYALDPSHWGQGLATEATQGLIAYLRNWISKDTLFATVDRDNVASINVLKKIGMKRTVAGLRIPANALTNHDIYELSYTAK